MISYMGRATSNQNAFVSCIHPHTHTHSTRDKHLWQGAVVCDWHTAG